MSRQTIKIKRSVPKTQVIKDRHGRCHCKTCGAFLSGRGKKK